MSIIAFHGQNRLGLCEELDQSQANIERYATTSTLLGQTFVAGATGQLTAIEVQDDSGVSTTFTIKLNDDNGATLYTDTVVLTGSQQKTKAVLSTPINIVSGQSYYFEFDGGASNVNLALDDTGGAAYANGDAYNQSGILNTIDLTFWTYICPFSGIDSPSDITSLREWWNPFDASSFTLTGSRVNQFNNQISSRHLTAASGQEPTWEDQGRIFFDGSTRTEILKNTSFGFTGQDSSIYQVVEISALNTAQYTVFGSATNTIEYKDTFTLVQPSFQRIGQSERASALNIYPLSTKIITFWRISDSNRSAGYIGNGEDEESTNTQTVGGTNNLTEIHWGGLYNGTSYFNAMKGYSYDKLFWDKYTSDSEHDQIIDYLKHKHNIS